MKINISRLIIFILLIGFTNLTFADPASNVGIGVFGQINQNSNDIANHEGRIGVLESVPPPAAIPVYNYHDYDSSPEISTKSFKLYDTKLSFEKNCRLEFRTINRTDNGDGTTSKSVKRTLYNGTEGKTCAIRVFEYLESDEDRKYLGDKNYLPDGSFNSEAVFTSPFTDRYSTMKVGVTWGHATGVLYTAVLPSPPTTFVSHAIGKVTFLGVEDVKVPYGEFTNCLKIHTLQSGFGSPSRNKITWHCKDVGLVKRVVVFSDGSRSIMSKLTGINIVTP